MLSYQITVNSDYDAESGLRRQKAEHGALNTIPAFCTSCLQISIFFTVLNFSVEI